MLFLKVMLPPECNACFAVGESERPVPRCWRVFVFRWTDQVLFHWA